MKYFVVDEFSGVFERRNSLWIPYQWRIQDFPLVGAPNPGGTTVQFGINFAENCMKMEKNGLRGGAFLAPPRSANVCLWKDYGDYLTMITS